jgi:hypothetical protein
MFLNPSTKMESLIAFMGFPCPKKRRGIIIVKSSK